MDHIRRTASYFVNTLRFLKIIDSNAVANDWVFKRAIVLWMGKQYF